MALGLFGKKKEEPAKPTPGAGSGSVAAGGGSAGGGDAGGPSGNGQGPEFRPDKAVKFFERARTADDTSQFEYSMQMWLGGLRQDPSSMNGLESFFQTAAKFRAEAGKKGPGKETYRAVDGRGDVDRLLSALLDWAMKPEEASLAVRATELASKLKLTEPAYWLGKRAMNAVAREKKPRKDLYVKLMESFQAIGAFEESLQACEAASRVDNDTALQALAKNLAAQATMAKGGYEKTGQAGGFRANVKDLDKQRELEMRDRVVKTDADLENEVARTEADYAKRPDDMAALNVYAKALLSRGTPADEIKAIELYEKGFEQHKQFRFRQLAGDVRMRIERRKVAAAKRAMDESPSDVAAVTAFEEARRALLRMEIEEFQLRVDAYPTDLGMKFELGRRCFENGEHERAIALFQESQIDAKHKVDSLLFLGYAFMKIHWLEEAIASLRQALAAHADQNDDKGRDIRYGLMLALAAFASEHRDVPSAEEADKLAASIAIQQFSFKDIRNRREAIKKLIGELKQGG